MVTLYRKYRPQNFEEVVNQNHVKITLQQEIATDSVAHAYLFCGPRAVGKTTIARVLSKSVNCTNREKGAYEPCNKCDSCLAINKGRSLDIVEIDAASHTGVDNVRENIISTARVAPSNSKYKVFIIDEVHMLSISAFNALLKTLEEPPKNVLFILCTTEVHKIPTTIISRCQRFDFKRIGINDLSKKLQYICKEEKIEVDKNILESIARLSEGHMRDAESMLGQIVAIGGKKITQEDADLVIPRNDLNEVVNFLEALSRKDAGSAIGLVNKLIDEGIELKKFIDDSIELARKLMLAKVNPVLSEKLGLELGEALEIKAGKLNNNFELATIIKVIRRLSQAKLDMKDSFIMQLPIEIAITELCEESAAIGRPQPAKADTGPLNSSVPNRSDTPPAIKTEPLTRQSAVDISLDAVNEKWKEVLARIKQHNHSLSFILRVCKPQDIKGNELCLAFKYKFHKDRINEANIKQIVEKVLADVYGTNLKVEAVIDEGLAVDEQAIANLPASQSKPVKESQAKDEPVKNRKKEGNGSGEDLMNNLLKTFGGKVVE